MAREEEIHIAASRYIEENSINGYVAISDHKDSFIEGAEWADTHPKSPWISVEDDLPCNHKELIDKNFKANFQKTLFVIALSNNNYEDLSCMINENGKWEWIAQGAYTHWMPIPKLPE